MGKKKVLAIDDEQIVLDSLTRVLSEEGYRVATCASGTKGLRQALGKPYDIVFTDLRMPDIGGMRVLRDIRRAKPALPVVMITGYGNVKTAVQAIKLGAAGFIQKPFTPEEVMSEVQSALRRAANRAPEEQALIHKAEVLRVLEEAGRNTTLMTDMLTYGSDALDTYNLTGPEKLAILTGDINWIEKFTGPLTGVQRQWLMQRLSSEIW